MLKFIGYLAEHGQNGYAFTRKDGTRVHYRNIQEAHGELVAFYWQPSYQSGHGFAILSNSDSESDHA